MNIGHLNIGSLNISFVFRHRWEKEQNFRDRRIFREYRFGIWYKPTKIVATRHFETPNLWKKNLVRSHMLGIDLIVFKAWVSWDRGGKHIEIEIDN